MGGDLGERKVGGKRNSLLTQQLLLLLRQLEFSVELRHSRRRTESLHSDLSTVSRTPNYRQKSHQIAVRARRVDMGCGEHGKLANDT